MNALTFLCVFGLLATLQLRDSMVQTGEAIPVSDAEKTLIVDLHDELRREVKPEPQNMCKVDWNKEAAKNAEAWAKTCPAGHSPMGKRQFLLDGKTISCGENIFKSTALLNWTTAVFSWYNEVHNFEYGKGSTNGKVIGHFLQVVWYKSHMLGCGVAHCPNNDFNYIYVCQYCPPGNLNLTHPYTVGSPCGACKDNCVDGLCTNPCDFNDYFKSCPKWTRYCKKLDGLCPASCRCKSNTIQ